MATQVKEPEATAGVAEPGGGLISNEKLRQLYATMLKCRMSEERMRILFEQKRASVDSFGRQEAVLVGTAIDLRAEDAIGLSHRELIVALIQGEPLDRIFCNLLSQSVSPPASVVAADLELATQAARANKNANKKAKRLGNGKKNDNIVLVYSSEDSESRGPWHEALTVAGEQELPMVFVCQNNPWAEVVNPYLGAGVTKSPTSSIRFPVITVDGDDVVAMYRVASEAIARARRGHGPTLIEARTDRWHDDSEIDRVRRLDSPGATRAKDPIAEMEHYLCAKGLFTENWKQELVTGFNAELDAAVALAEARAQGKRD